MRAVVALAVATAAVQGCSAPGEDPSGLWIASLEEWGKEFKDSRLPLCPHLSELPPLKKRGWAFVQPPPPPGFGEVESGTPVEADSGLDALRAKLPGRWFIVEKDDDKCFELTRPIIRGPRAVVTGQFGAGDSMIETWNFWLRQEDDGWRVVATTRGHHDI